MRVRAHLVPVHDIACAVRAEHRIRRVHGVVLGVVADGGNHLVRVVADLVAARRAGQTPTPLGVGGDLGPVVAHGGNRRFACDDRAAVERLRRVERAVHALNIAHRAADALIRQFERKVVVRLEQHVFRLHQSVAHGAVGCLAEVAALGVLDMGASGDDGDADISQR